MACFVCGKDHGTRHFFVVCSPQANWLREMRIRSDEMRYVATIQDKRYGG
jgi:hypothetical protein